MPTDLLARPAAPRPLDDLADDSRATGRRPGTISRRTELYEDAVAVVESDLASDLQLTEIAARIATSPRQLQRVFAEVGGTTFRQHRAYLRLDRARDHLRRGVSVSETAALVGYRHPAHFSAAFRERFGVVPSVYRDGAHADASGRHAA